MAEGIIIFTLWYIVLAFNYCKENFCDDDEDDDSLNSEQIQEISKEIKEISKEKKEEPPKIESEHKLAGDSDFLITPVLPEEKQDTLKVEDSPTVGDVVSELQNVAAAIEENLNN